MNVHLAALGRLIADPEQRMITAGNARARARMAIAMPQPHGADENASPPTLWRRLDGFARPTGNLARHRQGEVLSMSGRSQLSRYTTNAGEARDDWQLIDDSVIPSRTVRPSGGRRSGGGRGRRSFPAARDDGHQVNAPTHSLMTLSGSEAGR